MCVRGRVQRRAESASHSADVRAGGEERLHHRLLVAGSSLERGTQISTSDVGVCSCVEYNLRNFCRAVLDCHHQDRQVLAALADIVDIRPALEEHVKNQNAVVGLRCIDADVVVAQSCL